MKGKDVKKNKYEIQQLTEIKKWKAEEPGVIAQSFGLLVEPLAWLVRKVVPSKAIEGVLRGSNAMAAWMTDTKDVIRDGGVKAIDELRTKDLELSDKLADEVHNWAIGVAVVEGAGTGAAGLLGLAVDIPALITLSLRTIHKIGVCYGIDCSDETGRKMVLGILSAAGANSFKEKVAAVEALKIIEVTLFEQTWKKMAEKAVENQFGKESAILAIKDVAKQLGINITKRKALAAIPFIGAAIGGSVNGWYMSEIGWAARRIFQELWLLENKKIDEDEIN